ncbi:MAG: RsmD family RNA methyltransferase [Kiritimatiellales bacterium]
MRIISGKFGGRRFEVPENGMRPTKEQVREAVFSSLTARVAGARVLDLFAGAGGYGLEALSRGAVHVTAVEKAPAHWRILQQNFETVTGENGRAGSMNPPRTPHRGVPAAGNGRQECLPHTNSGNWRTVQSDVFDFLKDGGTFDLIFADPPYDDADLPQLAAAVEQVIAPDGLLVFEMRSSDPYSLPDKWTLNKKKKYGESRVLFLEKDNT